MSGCAHMNPDDFCGSCAPEKLREARREIERLLVRAENAEAEAAESLDALIHCHQAEERLRARWPHIEVPTRGSAYILGHQVLVDPGSPTCLRCSIEEELRGPVPSGEESRAERCPYCAKRIGRGDTETCDALCHRGGDTCACPERNLLIREWAQYEPCDDRAKALEVQIDRLSGYDGDTPKDWRLSVRGSVRQEPPRRDAHPQPGTLRPIRSRLGWPRPRLRGGEPA